jgi:hypothetical protein
MGEADWQQARLIPTSGINGSDEAERRATSGLLAVMGAVREFGLAVVKPMGAPTAQLDCFIEVPFPLGDETCRPDGLIQLTRAGKTWTALVEVKTGVNPLGRAQVENYLDIARDNNFDAVLTISNQMAPTPGVHPVDVDRRKLRKVALHHLSWAEVLTIAVQQRVHRGISDPDQAWILEELIRYLEHPKSGALDFNDMGGCWVSVRDAVANGTLRPNDKGLSDVISRWEQLVRFAALRLGRELGAMVEVQMNRRESADPKVRFAAQAQSLVDVGCLSGSLRIPDAVAPVRLTANLRSGQVIVTADIESPREGRATTRVNWLTRQLKDAPDGLRIDAYTVGRNTSTSELLKAVRENPALLIEEPKRDLRKFRVAAVSTLGSKRGVGRGAFIDSVLAALDGFYESVIQQLRPWTAKAPQLPRGGGTAAEGAGIDIQPPPGDLAEPADEDVLGAAPPEPEDTPAVVEAGVAEAEEPDQDDEGADDVSSYEVDEGLVSWDAARDRIEHERDVSSV